MEPQHLVTVLVWRLPFAFSHFPGGPEVRMIHMQVCVCVCVNVHRSVIPNTDAECSAVNPEAFFSPSRMTLMLMCLAEVAAMA